MRKICGCGVCFLEDCEVGIYAKEKADERLFASIGFYCFFVSCDYLMRSAERTSASSANIAFLAMK